MNNIEIYICVVINIMCLFIGYVLGYITKNTSTVSDTWCIPTKASKKQKEQEKTIEKIKSIDIDDSKFVIVEDISGLEKKFEDIAKTTDVHENIESSINKLSQIMKGK